MRVTKTILIIGTNGTGKTTFCNRLIEKRLQQNKRALVVTSHDNEWLQLDMVNVANRNQMLTFKGAKKIIFEDNTTLEHLSNNLYDCLLVFDDCRAYFSNHTDKHLHRLFISKRQQMLDIVAVAHGFTDVPKKFYTFANAIVLFKTLDNIHQRRNDIRHYAEMLKLQQVVNQKAKHDNHFHSIIYPK